MNEWIKKWRLEANMTQKELAEQLFLTPPAISQYESGKRDISLPVLKEIARVFQKNLSVQLIEEKMIQKITPELIEHTLKPLLINAPSLISLEEEDFNDFFSLEGEHYFLQTTNRNPFSATLDLFVDFMKEKNLDEAKGFILHIQGGSNFTFDHFDFFAEQIHKRGNEKSKILASANMDENREDFQLILCAFGFKN